ncbi:type II secretion system protein GspN [Geobacter sp. FeAm09]|uniref:type II secretion system protein GspN n=1 Tax=Geobacter sp. FeAm09 TaxID=2597769 RepID=UPI0011EE2952|nr:type II secretion system protein GspN [Geobacter sp. FeAm09]QEM69839.1 type II secretion system protein GspN [Geobacter sp. FeAm09]
MMPRHRLLRVGSLAAAGVALFLACTYLFLPTQRVNELLGRLLADQGLSLAPQAHKSLLPGLAWRQPVLSSDQGPLLRFDRLGVRLRLLPLVTGQAVVGATGTVGKGHLDLGYGITGTDALELAAAGIQLSDIPFFKTALGATAGGTLWSEGRLTRTKGRLSGDLKLELKQLSFTGVKLGAFPLPDAANLRCQGMVRVTSGRARLESFTLQGEGLYMRLSGDLPDGASAATQPLNLTLEIMPKPEFLDKQKLVFLLLAKFAASPGVYKVPIKGTLLKPVIL